MEQVREQLEAHAQNKSTEIRLPELNLEEIPELLFDCTAVEVLDLTKNNITKLPDDFSRLTNLKYLRLTDNPVADVTPLSGISTLKELHLQADLVTLPSGIEELLQLESLFLCHNKFTEIPDALFNLTQLQLLHLENNQLSAIPESLGKLTCLQELRLDKNQLTVVPHSLSALVMLERLSLDSNQLTEIPDLSALTVIKELHLDKNQLTEIPDMFGGMTQLSTAHLQTNKLTEVPESLLSLCETKVTTQLLLHGNDQLGIPPEILGAEEQEVDRGQTAGDTTRLASYVRAVQSAGGEELKEAKLIVVGPGGAGKSSLVEMIVEGSYTHGKSSTHGVVVTHWHDSEETKDIRLNIWDFGGQEIQHSTHEFFLTERAVYLLVLNPREDQGSQQALYYWLDLIHLVAPGARVIVALSKQDEYTGVVNDQESIKNSYPVVDFIPVSCIDTHESHKNIAALKDSIALEIENLPHVTNRLPSSWMQVKRKLEEVDKSYLPYSEFIELCKKSGIQEPDDQTFLVRLLHELGTMLNYADRMPLEDTHILDPTWVTEGVHAIVLSEDLMAQGGILKEDFVARLDELVASMYEKMGRGEYGDDPRYPTNACRFILQMMQRFDLCHLIEGTENEFLVPNALPLASPDVSPPNDSLRIEFHYKRLLPTSVISRFIVHMRPNRNSDVLWRQGVHGKSDQCEYLVTHHLQERKIKVAIWGDGRRRVLLERVRRAIQLANQKKRGLDCEQLVVLPQDPSATVSYEFLKSLADTGVKTTHVKGATQLHEISVESLLDSVGEDELVRKLLRVPAQAFSIEAPKWFPDIWAQFDVNDNHQTRVKLVVEEAQSINERERVEEMASVLMSSRRNRRAHAKDFATAPTVLSLGAAEAEIDDPFSILHISDFHFTEQTNVEATLQWLIDDLERNLEIPVDHIVVSGDFTDKGNDAGFEKAHEFVEKLCQRTNVDIAHVTPVLGNHDLQDLESIYEYRTVKPDGVSSDLIYTEGSGFLVRNEVEFAKRFERVARFYKRLFGSELSLNYEEQFGIALRPEKNIVFLSQNSAWKIDKKSRKDSNIHPGALSRMLQAYPEVCQKNGVNPEQCLKFFCMHHAAKGNEQIRDGTYLQHLATHQVDVILHGDVHTMSRDVVGYSAANGIHVAGAGSLASPQNGRPESTPRLYNLLQVSGDQKLLRVHTRCQEQMDGAWEGWNKWPPAGEQHSRARYPHYDLNLRGRE